MEFIKEIPIYVCKVDDNAVNGYSDPFYVQPPPDITT